MLRDNLFGGGRAAGIFVLKLQEVRACGHGGCRMRNEMGGLNALGYGNGVRLGTLKKAWPILLDKGLFLLLDPLSAQKKFF